MAQSFVIHVVEKGSPSNHHLISIDNPLQPLGASSIRAQTRLVSLTANNITYARVNSLGWWAAFPLPDTIPREYANGQYIRCPGWGYAEVIDSTIPGMPTGSHIFGYIPFCTLPFDLCLEPARTNGHYIDTTQYRQVMPAFYNRYIHSEFSLNEENGWNSLLAPLFETGQALNQYVFNWERGKRTHPVAPGAGPWTDEDADIEDAIVLIFAAGAKTALAFAYALKYLRPDQMPAAVIGIMSERSRAIAAGSGYYDETLLYDDLEASKTIIKERSSRILMVDFGSQGAADKWFTSLQAKVDTEIAHLCVAAVPKVETRGQQVSVPHIKASALNLVGEQEYFRLKNKDWDQFRGQLQKLGLRLKWNNGLDEFVSDWTDLVNGQSELSSGLLYTL